jgi:outer membrane protein TolC
MRRTLWIAPWLALALAAAAPLARAEEPPQAVAPPRLAFDEAVRRALARNPSAAIAQQDVRKAEALVEQARAASLPTLTGNGVYTHLDDDRQFSGRVILSQNQLSANLTLTVPIVAPKAWMQWSHASDAADLARMGATDVRRQLAVAAGRSYLAVVAQKRVLQAAEHALATAKAQREFASARVAGGVGNRIEEVRAMQEQATADARVKNALTALDKAREALGVVVGEEGPVDSSDDVALKDLPTLSGALDEARVRRSDVRAAEVRERAAERVVRDDWTDYMPLLTGNLQPFYQEPATLTQPKTGWQVQLVLTLPLYDGGLRYGQEREREANAASARAQVDAALRQARSEVRAAFLAVQRADQALESARDAAKLASEALDLATTAYRAGATTNLEVVDAARRAHEAATAAAVAEDASRQARLDLLAACGRFP